MAKFPWQSAVSESDDDKQRFERHTDQRIRADTFLSLVTRPFKPDRVDLVSDLDRPGAFVVRHAGEGYEEKYELSFYDSRINKGWMNSTRADRNIGRTLFAYRLIAASVLDFNKVHLMAGDMMGGYIWAKAGVYIAPNDERHTSSYMEGRLKALSTWLPQDVYDKAYDLIQLKNKNDLREIAMLDHGLEYAGKLFNRITLEQDPTADLQYADYVKRKFFGETEMTLGQFLLAGLTYDAYVDLKDDRQMNLIEAYTRVPVRNTAYNFLELTRPVKFTATSAVEIQRARIS